MDKERAGGEPAVENDRLTQLCDLRDLLTDSLYEVKPSYRAPLAAQLRGTLAEIEELESAAQPAGGHAETPLEVMKRERAARLAS